MDGQRENGGPKDPVWLGIRTNATGEIFTGKPCGIQIHIDFSHGDGFCGLTEVQTEAYIQILEGALAEMKQKGKKIRLPPGMVNMPPVRA